MFHTHRFTYPCTEACKISSNTAIIVCAIAVIACGNYRSKCFYEKHGPDFCTVVSHYYALTQGNVLPLREKKKKPHRREFQFWTDLVPQPAQLHSPQVPKPFDLTCVNVATLLFLIFYRWVAGNERHADYPVSILSILITHPFIATQVTEPAGVAGCSREQGKPYCNQCCIKSQDFFVCATVCALLDAFIWRKTYSFLSSFFFSFTVFFS